MTPRVLEQLADWRRANARVHLHAIGAAREQEGRFGFAGDRSREQRLAGARRSDEQDAFRNTSANRGEAFGLAEEIDDFLDFLFGLVHTRHIVEGYRGRFLVGLARLALERGDATARHAVQREAEHADEAKAEDERAVAVCIR